MSSLNQALRAALDNRHDLLAELHTQGTDCYRLFHGSQEGAGGLTIDRYGPQLLVQSFHQSLETADLLDLHQLINQYMGLELLLVYNDRARGNSRIDREDTVYRAEPGALEDLVGHEWGLNYRVRGRHAGQDPLLFLDLRNTRGWVKDHSAGKSVLNLFAYTCGVGLSAAAGGAREVCNLGNGTGFSVRQMVEAARRVTGHEIAVAMGARRPGDPARLVASAQRAREVLGWTARADIDSIIASAWMWHSSHPNGFEE